MIKRSNITVLDGQCLAAMSAHSEGSYVRYADIAHLLEEKTLEQHRVEFEAWYGSYDVRTPQHPFERHVAWLAWMGARGIKE